MHATPLISPENYEKLPPLTDGNVKSIIGPHVIPAGGDSNQRNTPPNSVRNETPLAVHTEVEKTRL